jgi:hypothetical protein
VHRIWVRRAKGRPCGMAHALIPAICLLGRLDAGGRRPSGPWCWYAHGGCRSSTWPAPPPGIGAATIGPEHRMLASGLAVMAVGLGSAAPLLSADPEARGVRVGCRRRRGGGNYRNGVLTETAFRVLRKRA